MEYRRYEIYTQDGKMTSDHLKENPDYFDEVLMDSKGRLTIKMDSSDLYFELKGDEGAVKENIKNIESKLPIKLKLLDKSKSN